MEIQISSTKKIISGKRQWIYCEKLKKPQIRKDGKKIEWKEKWFFPTIEICYESLLNSLVRESDKKNLKKAVEEGVELLKEVKREILTLSKQR